MSESTDKQKKAPEPLDPRVRDAYLTEGGTARYPEGTKMRGHDMNALLDKMDRDEKPAEEPASS